MELRHLRYFVAVAEELHFRRAAERLHMSQPPLSQQIRQLEEEVGAVLLLRNQRKVELTAAGAAFLVRAREILDAVEDAARQARRVQRGEVGRLAVGFVGSAMYSFVPELLRAFREDKPDVGLRLHELGTTEQLRQLEDGRLDWQQPALAIGRRARGVTPEPGAWTMLDGQRIKLEPVLAAPESAALRPGKLAMDGKRVLVGTGSHPVELTRVQPAGKKMMTAADWARGQATLESVVFE